MVETVFLLWIDHLDSYELVGIYSEKELAEKDELRIEPKTIIYERMLNKGISIFLEDEKNG